MNNLAEDTPQLIAIGRISGAHGVKGQIRLHSYSGNIDTLQAMHDVQLMLPDRSIAQFELLKAVNHSGKVLLSLAGINSANDVDRLIGAELMVMQDQLPELADDEFYWQDLIGLTVVTDTGFCLGRISKIMETGANDVYLVEGKEKEYLIPAISEVVKNIDLCKKVMTIVPLHGLLDL